MCLCVASPSTHRAIGVRVWECRCTTPGQGREVGKGPPESMSSARVWAHARPVCGRTSRAERPWSFLLREAPVSDWGVTLPAPYRGPKLGGQGGPRLPAEHSLALAPSPFSSRDDVIGKVCLTRDTLAAHPKGKVPRRKPVAHYCFPSLAPGPSLVCPVCSLPAAQRPSSRLPQALCSGRANSTLPEGPCPAHPLLCPGPPSASGLGPHPPEQKGC